MKTKQNKQDEREYPIHVIREQLRQCSVREAAELSRSVGRLTSYDALPCVEYRQEVDGQHAAAERLIYIQHCRGALERCIASGASSLRFRWRDGRVTCTRFRKTSPARVRVIGLLAGKSLPAAG